VTCQTLHEAEVRIVPNHVCVVTNLFEELLGVRGEAVELRWPVAGGR
jgi:D-serine deaminase-like pyridoxal phosphate-dependent protein